MSYNKNDDFMGTSDAKEQCEDGSLCCNFLFDWVIKPH